MGVPVPTMVLSTTQALSAEQRRQLKDRFANVENFDGTKHEQRAKPSVSQCCPNCGAPATRNILHCEYCRTQFSDSTPGIDIYALCDFDPETERMVNGKIRSYLDDALIEVTTMEDPAPRYIERMSPAAAVGTIVGSFFGCPHIGCAIATRLSR